MEFMVLAISALAVSYTHLDVYKRQVEYGLIIGLVALAVIGALAVLGPKIADMFTNASDQLTTTARP